MTESTADHGAEHEGPAGLLPGFEPAVRTYLFVGSAGLLLFWLGLFEKGYSLFALVPVLLGAFGLAVMAPPDWLGTGALSGRLPASIFPVLMLIMLAVLEVFFGYATYGTQSLFLLSDLLIVLGFLYYAVGQYRLWALRAFAVPPDPRTRPQGGGDAPEPRPTSLFVIRELRWPALTLPLVVVLGQLVWQWVIGGDTWFLPEDSPQRLGMSPAFWRVYSLVWLLGVGGLILGGVGAILRLHRLNRDEARLFGQDTLWTETRGEQRRLNRWLAWLRRKRGRKAGELP